MSDTPTPQSPDDLTRLREENAALRGALDDLAAHHTDHHDAEAETDASDDRLDAPAFDRVRANALAMLAASHESTVLDLSLATAASFALRGIHRNWNLPSRQKAREGAFDLDGLLENPVVKAALAKVLGQETAPAVVLSDEPNLTILCVPGATVTVTQGDREVTRRMIPPSSIRRLRLVPALYTVVVRPVSTLPGFVMDVDLIDEGTFADTYLAVVQWYGEHGEALAKNNPLYAIGVTRWIAEQGMAREAPAPEPIVPDAPATPAGELSPEAVPS